MRKLGLVVAILVVAILLLGGANSAVPGQQQAAPPKDDVLGKYVFVYGGVHAGALEDAKVKKLGDRYFVVGRVVRDPALPNRQGGAILYIPLSDVKSLSAYETLDDLKKAWGKSDTP
jgi:hypothetical protein